MKTKAADKLIRSYLYRGKQQDCMKAIPSTAVPVEIEAEQNNLRRVVYWVMVLHTIPPRQPQLATFMDTNVEKSIWYTIPNC